MNKRTLPSQFLYRFVETIASELDQDNLSVVLEKAGLPSDRSDPVRWGSLSGKTAAEGLCRVAKRHAHVLQTRCARYLDACGKQSLEAPAGRHIPGFESAIQAVTRTARECAP